MKNLFLSITASSLITSLALASGGHYHPKKVVSCPSNECTPAQIEAAVPAAIEDLSKWGKIDSVWVKAKVESVVKKTFKKGPEWIITLNDNGKKRYLFVTMDGYVNGSNDTGN